MDRPNVAPDWTFIRDRWPEYARRVQEQWPEIELIEILATHGHRDRLVRTVGATYGLDPVAADRAVSIWHAVQAGLPDCGDAPATTSVA